MNKEQRFIFWVIMVFSFLAFGGLGLIFNTIGLVFKLVMIALCIAFFIWLLKQ